MSQPTEPGPGNSEDTPEGVISLCDHRRRHLIKVHSCDLVGHLTKIHQEAIKVHNQVIERAKLSVLTEFCRAAGLCFDAVDAELRAAVITPAALYGDSGTAVFGKKPLQERIIRSITESLGDDFAQLLRALNSTHPAVWDYKSRRDDDLCTDLATPLAGPSMASPDDMAGVIIRNGQFSRESGIYCGWKINYEDISCIVFGYRLDRSREVSVRNFLASRDDREDTHIWRSIELPLLRTIVDPDKRHQPPGREKFGQSTLFGFRQAASRRGLLLAIRRTLWRHFAEPAHGLTIHAHIAALIDDPDCRQAFLDEVQEITDTVTIKSGGLRNSELSITLDDVLAPFFLDSQARLLQPLDLENLPIAMLLLDEDLVTQTGFSEDDTIEVALSWCKEHSTTPTAHEIESAWSCFRTEQNLVATYGLTPDEMPEGGTPALPFAQRSAVLPNLRTLFDPRFTSLTLADLDLPDDDARRLSDGLARAGLTLKNYPLDHIKRDERSLTDLHGVNHDTCNAVRRALLQLASSWRRRPSSI